MQRLTKEHEIQALQRARKKVLYGYPYICALITGAIKAPTANVARDMTTLIDEVEEFLDGAACVESWLRVPERYGVVRTYRIAIIDVLLARRGVQDHTVRSEVIRRPAG